MENSFGLNRHHIMNGDYDRSSSTSILPVGTHSFSIGKREGPQKGESVEVYLTPDSKDSSSDNDNENDWKQQDFKQLKYLAHYDLSFPSVVERLPGVSLNAIQTKLYQNCRELAWTRGEVVLLCMSIQNGILLERRQLPFRSNDQIESKEREIAAMLQKLEFSDNSWTKEDIAVLIFQIGFDLTSSGLFEELPDKEQEEIGQILAKVLPLEWTPMELYYLQLVKKDNTEPFEDIIEELPFRHEQAVKAKLDFIEPLSITLDTNLVEYLVSAGFYRDRLRLEFPGIPTRDLVWIAKKVTGSVRYKEQELNIIKSCTDNGKSLKYIQSLLPLRTLKSLEGRVKSFSNKYRRAQFKNSLEELKYMTEWYCSDDFEKGRGKRRKVKPLEDVNIHTQDPLEQDITREEFEQRKQQKIEQDERKRIRNEELKQERNKKRLEWASRPKVKKVPSVAGLNIANELKEEAMYFQSVTGDRKLIKDNEKRKRQKTAFFVPQFEDRKILKNIMNKKSGKKKALKGKSDNKTKKKSKKASGSKAKGKGAANLDKEEEDDEEEEEEEDEEEEEEEEEVEVSPYDPYDITVDTEFEAPNRKMFIPEVYGDNPTIPRLLFEPENTNIESVDESGFNKLYATEMSAYNIVRDYRKSYRNMGDSFPPITIVNEEGELIINPNNKLRLRSLFYPEYCEMFILAEPKQNQLNSIYEMQKLFQIHYCLYFSPSQRLKTIIFTEYCEGIEKAAEENDFKRFILIVDKWNMLMLLLSPSKIAPELLERDINPEVRKYLSNENSIPLFQKEELLLDAFFEEIHLEAHRDKLPKQIDEEDSSNQAVKSEDAMGTFPTDTAPANFVLEIVQKAKEQDTLPSQDVGNTITTHVPEIKWELGQLSMSQLNLAGTVSTEEATKPPIEPKIPPETETIGQFSRPISYVSDFYKSLQERSHVSRFCMQQLLIRVYSRVVSTRSSQLRRYKAFTAEVYGELLPSFVSEVLTKVGFQPNQRFYDLGSGVGNTSFQAALEFGAGFSGGCELMSHASKLTEMQQIVLDKQLKVFGIQPLNMKFALAQSFVNNEQVRKDVLDCHIVLVNNYLFDMSLNIEVGRMLYGLKPGTKIISLRNFITPRYKSTGDLTVFDYLEVEKHEMSDFLSVSWTANKVPYYISTVKNFIQPQYLQ